MKPETKSDVCEKCGGDVEYDVILDYDEEKLEGDRTCVECGYSEYTYISTDTITSKIAKQLFHANFNAAKEASK